jgi:hypothetical protein
MTDIPFRVLQRPDPVQWTDDELMNLPEAAALFWPDGPLTVASLRTAIRDEQLAVAVIAGKFLTTKAAVTAMSACRIGAPPVSQRPETMGRDYVLRKMSEDGSRPTRR